MLSATQKSLHPNNVEDIKDSLPKLVPNLYNKEKYIVHYRNLKQYLEYGMVLKKVHKILAFDQAPWLEPYIKFNTLQRSRARNDFEKDFFKLMNNAVFGKTMENLRNRIKVDLLTDDFILKKRAAQPTFKAFKIFHENLVAVERLVSELTLNRPIYAGFCILEMSKTLMYQWHYGYVKQRYPGEKSKLLFTDTDSLVYSIQTKDLYDDMLNDQDLFDFSGYPKEHPCFSNKNKKVIGKMKDELNSLKMDEFVGLRAKSYSVSYESNEMKKAKGVKKCVVKNNITHNDYKKCLMESIKFMHTMKTIRSYNHELFSIEQNKRTLSSYDDKRFILENNIDTLSHGHYKIKSL